MDEQTNSPAKPVTNEEQMAVINQLITGKPQATHPNVAKMWCAFEAVVEELDFFTSDAKVNKFLDACKLPDSAPKYWRSSMTNARKELNNKAMEEAKITNMPVVMPSDDEIEDLAIEKFKETWKKHGKGKPLPKLPLEV